MLIESITLAQRDNKELEALIYRFRPLIRKCGRQLHIEDGEQEMVVAFIELIKRFRPERLRSQDDGKVVQYIKNAMNYSCFKIYKKHHNPIATIISLEEITVKEEFLQVGPVSAHDPGAARPEVHQNAPSTAPSLINYAFII